MIATGHTLRGFSSTPAVECDCIAGPDAHHSRKTLGIDSVEDDQSVVELELQMAVNCARSFKGEVLGIEPLACQPADQQR